MSDNMEHLDPTVPEVTRQMNFSDTWGNKSFPSLCFDFNHFKSSFYHLPLVDKFLTNISGDKFLEKKYNVRSSKSNCVITALISQLRKEEKQQLW